ncbi:hypothetical protein ABXV18_27015 [Vibrio owensii]|uniref:hypothetical protein n=1 Tax=Vibrio owensii TaxID=696485 RepID=UPI003395748F
MVSPIIKALDDHNSAKLALLNAQDKRATMFPLFKLFDVRSLYASIWFSNSSRALKRQIEEIIESRKFISHETLTRICQTIYFLS